MSNRQKDAATTYASSSLKIISVSAVALLIGIGAAAAQGGSARQTEHTLEKQKDAELLTPIRPLPRKIGETSWPEAKPEAQREANERKAATPRETTGQSTSAETKKIEQPNNAAAANNQPNTTAPQAAQNTTAPQAAQNNTPAINPPPSTPQPTTAQNNVKPQQPQTNQPNQTTQQPPQVSASQPAQSTPAPNTAQPNPQGGQQNNSQQAQNQNNSQSDHASIRLGTDASGKVAINEEQEQQLSRALRRARPIEVNVGVQIGGPSPEGVRLAAVSRDIVDVLPQFRGYSYFATSEQIYIVDASANRVVAMVPVKLTATAKREKPSRSTVGSAHAAQPEPAAAPAAPAPTASVTATSEPRSKRATRRGDDLAGIEAAIEREVQRKGLEARGRTVVVEEAPAIRRVPTRHWRPWFAGDVQ